jgi:hypothetical protein
MGISLGRSLFGMKNVAKQSTSLQGIETGFLNCLVNSLVTIKTGTYKEKCLLTQNKLEKCLYGESTSISSLLRQLKIHHLFYISLPLSSINPLRIFTRQYFNVSFKIILTSHRP